jgi:hypothetical protein
MKSKLNALKIILIALLIVGCSSSDDSSGSNSVFGTIQLSGSDTSSIGTSLTVGNIDEDALDTTGTSSSVVLSDENTTFVNGEPNVGNFLNAFIIVAAEFTVGDGSDAQKAISMTILKDGEEFSYVCSTPATSSADNTDCGTGFSVDKSAKRIVFNDTTVINVDSGAILTMNGTIDYN